MADEQSQDEQPQDEQPPNAGAAPPPPPAASGKPVVPRALSAVAIVGLAGIALVAVAVALVVATGGPRPAALAAQAQSELRNQAFELEVWFTDNGTYRGATVAFQQTSDVVFEVVRLEDDDYCLQAYVEDLDQTPRIRSEAGTTLEPHQHVAGGQLGDGPCPG